MKIIYILTSIVIILFFSISYNNFFIIKKVMPENYLKKIKNNYPPHLRKKIKEMENLIIQKESYIFSYEKLIKRYVEDYGKYFDENVRYSNLNDRIKIKCEKNIPIILIIGQSNAANSLQGFDDINNDQINFFNQNCYKLKSPTLGATGNLFNIASGISNKLNNSKKFIFLTNAWGGTSIDDWARDDSLLTAYVNKNLTFLNKNENRLKYIIWIQGESDFNNYKDYEIKFKKLINNLLKGIKLDENFKLFITQTSICKNLDEEKLIRSKKLNNEQIKAGNYKNYFTLEITDNLDQNYRYDYCHFNQKGFNKISEELVKYLN